MGPETIITLITLASILIGWGVTWANQNAKIGANKTSIDLPYFSRKIDIFGGCMPTDIIASFKHTNIMLFIE